MLSSERTRATGVLNLIGWALLALPVVLLVGCSADVTRFNYSGNGATASIPIPTEPVNRGPNGPPRGLGLTEAPLPPPDTSGNYRVVGRRYDTAAPPPPAPPPAKLTYYRPMPPPPAKTHDRPPPYQAPTGQGGETVEVQPGETLYGIARRHGVAVAAIKEANGLTSETVRPGQRLIVPHSGQDRASLAKAPPPADQPPPAKHAALDRGPLTKQPPPPAIEPPPGWGGRYTMRNGDSLYGVALRHRVSLDELMRANGITHPTRVWAGTVLAVPEQPEPETATKAPPRVSPPPRIINAPPEEKADADARRKTASRDEDASPAPAVAGKFRWPARGRIIVGFGKRPDGGHNDGINLAVPMGTDIHAAEAGRVAYAGNELKGYGNLILIRHPNGWVSAYAHADKLLVRASQVVKRGQVIAKSGKTGAVDQPQLHFELRQGSRPVNPLPHMAN
jgi:murein DD-endopeptidase MepM/ murein hydrolase activator NlpD